ncbi:MAG: B12-binding domain-containing radical SAM protein [Oscillochloridaceae bacterium umkhey_bin13]
MNIALIALPNQAKLIYPPLSLAYLATLLEQRRHIVRIYDLALDPEQGLASILSALRSFRPQLVVVVSEPGEPGEPTVEVLRGEAERHTHLLEVQMLRNGLDVLQATTRMLAWLDQQRGVEPTPPPHNLDQLPLPARHLLPLERYHLRAPGGELQTTLLMGAIRPDGHFALRSPERLVAEVRSISHEFGLRHYLLSDVPITLVRPWLDELLDTLSKAQLGIGWEANTQPEQLDANLLARFAAANCECLTFQLDAISLFESSATREALRQAVTHARQHGIFIRANLKLEPPYESIPQLVDVAATFGLDDVHFDVAQADAASVGADEAKLREMARQMYDQGRDRQRFIKRFGPTLGGLLWRLRGPRGQSQFDDEGLPA